VHFFLCVLSVFLKDERATCVRYVADAYYSGIPGAKLVNMAQFDGEVWVFDCTAEINATIIIGGQSYPIHPLDMSQQDVGDNGKPFCYGSVRVYSQGTMCEADPQEFKVPTSDIWGGKPDVRCDPRDDVL
jgi:hypothetical protein